MNVCVQNIVNDLEDPMRLSSGKKIETKEEWEEQKERIKKLLIENVYGTMPEMTDNIRVLFQSEEKKIYQGRAAEQVFLLTADKMYDEFSFGLRIVKPVTDQKVPVLFMVLGGSSEAGYQHELAEMIVTQYGYAIAMVDREPAAPDIPGADIRFSVEPEYAHDEYLYYCAYRNRRLKFPDKNLPIEEYMEQYPYVFKYGKIALGAHCVRLAVSFVLRLDFANEKQLAVTGHSRDGKVALCAGVFDERLAAVVPLGSGCGGAALYKVPTKGLETIDDQIKVWPSWLPALAKYIDNQYYDMPVDMHMARACIAPRGFMNGEGLADFWAGPFSAYVGKEASQPAYDFFGVPENNGMYIREGFHEMSKDDIIHTIMFCNRVFFGKNPTYDFEHAEYELSW